MNSYYVYIMASKRNGTLYIGITNDLLTRVEQHKSDIIEGFTKRYKVHTLVYFEQTSDVKAAISREKQIKKWHRAWKLKLIESKNPNWKDLYEELL
ncbi:MAG: GIY-YIG nuclease family protein [bacterium]|nr:GIY-YIG nuclease family protein [bacterium]